MTSTWDLRVTPDTNNEWYSVTYGNSLFVAVSRSGSSNTNRVMTSPDGITWTIGVTPNTYNSWYSVTYGNGLFVAVSTNSSSNTNRVMTSPDGITWTIGTTPDVNNPWLSVTYGNGLFVAVSDAGSNTNRVMTNGSTIIICYAKGTLISTNRGFVPIENIKCGDKVVTKGKIYRQKFIKRGASNKVEPVIWISKFKVSNMNSKSRPICIKKDALGENYPFQDLYVSPGHRVLLNGKMALSKNLVNGKTIYQDNTCESVEYYHLECKHHSAIYANGVLAESYFDKDNRHVFENSVRINPKLKLKI